MTTTMRVSGKIKWYDPVKRYGFVSSPSLTKDALLPKAALDRFGAVAVFDGAEIEVDVRPTEKGYAVDQVIMLQEGSPDTCESYTVAEVKWYNAVKGFGFVTRGEGTPDLFLHAEIVKSCGLPECRPGQKVYIQFEENDKGGRVTDVRAYIQKMKEPEPLSLSEQEG